MLRLQRAEGRGGRRRQTVVLLGADRRASHHLAGVVVDGDDGALDGLGRFPGVDAHDALGLEGDVPGLADRRGAALCEHRLHGRRRRRRHLRAVLHGGVGDAAPRIHRPGAGVVEGLAERRAVAAVDADAAGGGVVAWAHAAGRVHVEEVDEELRPGVRRVRALEGLNGDPAEYVQVEVGAARDRGEAVRATHHEGFLVILGVPDAAPLLRPRPRVTDVGHEAGLEQRRRLSIGAGAPRASVGGGGGRGGGERGGEDAQRRGHGARRDIWVFDSGRRASLLLWR
mmetsp:Transcript_23300/g.66323  ORF Transcript_23300/g.66323 Transcript_23300/m.66323 type:complete len:284 (-) Transcript_23300:31-882(-)